MLVAPEAPRLAFALLQRPRTALPQTAALDRGCHMLWPSTTQQPLHEVEQRTGRARQNLQPVVADCEERSQTNFRSRLRNPPETLCTKPSFDA